jgi:GNAT superfamily N-acetyltransferase
MPFGTWWRGDPLPDLSPLPTFSAKLSTDTQLIAQLADLPEHAVDIRFQTENQLYLAFMGDVPAAYGWVAAQEGRIGEIQLFFPITPHNRYLWDFKTLPEWRGRGIYPRLLQFILRQEQSVERFWIGYAPDNDSSARGISKAGFQDVGDLVLSGGRASGLKLLNTGERAKAFAGFFQLPVVPST